MKNLLNALLILGVIILSIQSNWAKNDTASKVELGIDVLTQKGFRPLAGKRVGLLTHPAGVNSEGCSTLDLLVNHPKIHLVALFGPEHGIDGKATAEQHIPHQRHPTGIPIYSLYGPTRKPTKDMLKGMDVLVVDLQDIGVRSYTYIGCLRYVMEACFENGVEVMILDRPNPLGGLKVDGPLVDKDLLSYVGPFPTPYVHGLTIGEIARIAKAERGWLNISGKAFREGKLTVIPMIGWKRTMLWPQTGLQWIPSSSAIPDVSAVIGYSITGLGTYIGGFKHGYGTKYPFRLLTYPGKNARHIKGTLEKRSINGLGYKVIDFKDSQGRPCQGIYVLVSDWNQFKPTELSFHLMQLDCEWSNQNPFTVAPKLRKDIYTKLVGSASWVKSFAHRGAGIPLSDYLKQWDRDARRFQRWGQQYWLYE